MPHPHLEKRILAASIKDQQTGCWIWQRFKGPAGYGMLGIKALVSNRPILAHRAAWLIFKGEIPNGLFVCHHCDNTSCVNPEHLFIGTPKENTQDCVSKQRHARAEKLATRFDTAAVQAIQAAYLTGETQLAIAERLGVYKHQIAKICCGTSWASVTKPIRLKHPKSGERSGMCKFPDTLLLEVKALRAAGTTYKLIADKLGMSKAHARRICLGTSHAVVTERVL